MTESFIPKSLGSSPFPCDLGQILSSSLPAPLSLGLLSCLLSEPLDGSVFLHVNEVKPQLLLLLGQFGQSLWARGIDEFLLIIRVNLITLSHVNGFSMISVPVPVEALFVPITNGFSLFGTRFPFGILTIQTPKLSSLFESSHGFFVLCVDLLFLP